MCTTLPRGAITNNNSNYKYYNRRREAKSEFTK